MKMSMKSEISYMVIRKCSWRGFVSNRRLCFAFKQNTMVFILQRCCIYGSVLFYVFYLLRGFFGFLWRYLQSNLVIYPSFICQIWMRLRLRKTNFQNFLSTCLMMSSKPSSKMTFVLLSAFDFFYCHKNIFPELKTFYFTFFLRNKKLPNT